MISPSLVKKVLAVRVDRIGDVILTTPAFQALKKHLPQAELTVLVRPSIAEILRPLPFIDQVIEFDPTSFSSKWDQSKAVKEILKPHGFDAAVVFQDQPGVSLGLWRASIPHRVGPWSKPLSFFYFNRGMKQSRSRVRMHEADYNLELVSHLTGFPTSSRSIPTEISLSPSHQKAAQEWLTARGWNSQKPLVVVHPGMGGSASNWPLEHYEALIQKLIADQTQVLLSSGPQDQDSLAYLKGKLSGASKSHLFVFEESQPLPFLVGLFSHAQLVIAPSTGPLHIAVALKKPVISFYPSIPVQSPKRWGPYTHTPHHVFTHESSDLSKISVEETLQQVNHFI